MMAVVDDPAVAPPWAETDQARDLAVLVEGDVALDVMVAAQRPPQSGHRLELG